MGFLGRRQLDPQFHAISEAGLGGYDRERVKRPQRCREWFQHCCATAGPCSSTFSKSFNMCTQAVFFSWLRKLHSTSAGLWTLQTSQKASCHIFRVSVLERNIGFNQCQIGSQHCIDVSISKTTPHEDKLVKLGDTAAVDHQVEAEARPSTLRVSGVLFCRPSSQVHHTCRPRKQLLPTSLLKVMLSRWLSGCWDGRELFEKNLSSIRYARSGHGASPREKLPLETCPHQGLTLTWLRGTRS